MKKLPFPFPSNHKELVTRKAKDGKTNDFEVRFTIEKLRASRSAESRRRWTQGIDKEREKVWVVVGLGMFQKIGQAKYQLRGIIYSQPRGERLFRYVLTEKELVSLLALDGTFKAEIAGLFARVRKTVVMYGAGFVFQTRDFLQKEMKSLIETGKVSRPVKWHD